MNGVVSLYISERVTRIMSLLRQVAQAGKKKAGSFADEVQSMQQGKAKACVRVLDSI